MSKIAIQLPMVETDDKVEVELTINGRRHKLNYRVELFNWIERAAPDESKIDCLKRLLAEYDRDWQVVEIGEPSDCEFSVLFKQQDVLAEV